MDIQKLQEIMVSQGVVLRAIPKKVVGVYEKYHADQYPHGTVKYLDKYKREMLVVEDIPKNAGKFVFECQNNTSATVRFTGRKFFDTIEQAVEDLLQSKGVE